MRKSWTKRRERIRCDTEDGCSRKKDTEEMRRDEKGAARERKRQTLR